MSTITDLNGDEITWEDITSSDMTGENYKDSNVNVYEFGNLILADILPTILVVVSVIADYSGILLSATDTTEDSVTITDETISVSSLEDFFGSASESTDISGTEMSQEDFGGNLTTGVDIEVEIMSVAEDSGSNGVWVDNTVDNSIIYDFSSFSYDEPSVTYNGFAPQGTVVDILGS